MQRGPSHVGRSLMFGSCVWPAPPVLGAVTCLPGSCSTSADTSPDPVAAPPLLGAGTCLPGSRSTSANVWPDRVASPPLLPPGRRGQFAGVIFDSAPPYPTPQSISAATASKPLHTQLLVRLSERVGTLLGWVWHRRSAAEMFW